MARIARIVIPDCPHHITQRGNNHQDVFFTDDDRRLYLRILGAQSERYGLSIIGYCLMTNHIHLIAVPQREESLAKAIGRTHWIYTQTVNRLHGRSGHLWQNRFYSCALDNKHLWTALRYVECNPVRAKLSRYPWTYRWSSASFHVNGQTDEDELLDLKQWSESFSLDEWIDFLSVQVTGVGRQQLMELRLHTTRGRPLGSDRFIAKLEHKLNRRLRPLPTGRPPKQSK